MSLQKNHHLKNDLNKINDTLKNAIIMDDRDPDETAKKANRFNYLENTEKGLFYKIDNSDKPNNSKQKHKLLQIQTEKQNYINESFPKSQSQKNEPYSANDVLSTQLKNIKKGIIKYRSPERGGTKRKSSRKSHKKKTRRHRRKSVRRNRRH